jgi:anti-anti-sigma factor
MDIHTHTAGTEFVARLGGRLMFSDNAAFRGLFDDMSRSGASTFVLDLTDLAAVDSAGLGMFIIAKDTAVKNGWHMVLRRPSGQVRQLISLARFDSLMTVEG